MYTLNNRTVTLTFDLISDGDRQNSAARVVEVWCLRIPPACICAKINSGAFSYLHMTVIVFNLTDAN